MERLLSWAVLPSTEKKHNSVQNCRPTPTLWEQKTGRCVGRSSEVAKINRLLDGIRVRATDLYHKHLHEYGYALPEKIKNNILGIETDKKKMLFEYFDEHNEFYLLKIGHDTSQITYGRYLLTQNRLKEYLKEEYNLSDIPVIELTPVFIEKFFLYIQNKHHCSNNTALKFIQRFRTVFNYIKNTGADIKADPFACFRFKTKKVVREILTQEEIDAIYKKEFLTKRLSQVRHIFIFCCYTGLSFIDICSLKSEDIKVGPDKKLWIMILRQKTGLESNIPLLKIPLEIIKNMKKKILLIKIYFL